MAASRDATRYIAINPIKRDRKQEFELFINDVVVPLVKQARPQLADMWQVLRPADTGDGPVVYAFVFYGDTPLAEWDLNPLFSDVYGDEEGARYSERLDDFFASQQQVYAFSGAMLAT